MLQTEYASWRRRLTVGSVVLFAALAMNGCLAGNDECDRNTMRCNGSLVEWCEPPCSDMGCAAHWRTRTECTAEQVCVQVDPAVAQCAMASSPDPRCAGNRGFCDGVTSVGCTAGFVVSRDDCTTADGGVASRGSDPACTVGTGRLAHSVCTSGIRGFLCGLGGVTSCGVPNECGPIVHPAVRTETASVGAGGTVTDGLYVLQQVNVYGGSISESTDFQNTLRLEQGTLAISIHRADAFDGSGTFVIDGTSLVWDVTCPARETLSFGFTATATSLTTYEALGGSVFEQLYAKQ